MRRAGAFCATVLALAACQAPPSLSPAARYLQAFERAEADIQTFAPVTELRRETAFADAYALQRQIVATRARRGDKAVGYKGGLMSTKSLADRNVTEPLTGVLFQSGDLAAGATVELCGYRRAVFEMKLGYVTATPISRNVSSVQELRALVSHVQPVVELPDIAYRDDKSYGAIDMAAANISSARFVRGLPSAKEADLDALDVVMHQDGALKTRGSGRESLGNQWESLRTIVNLILAHSGPIAPGSLVLTGKIGDKVDVGVGDYQADYGPLGSVRFQVRRCAR